MNVTIATILHVAVFAASIYVTLFVPARFTIAIWTVIALYAAGFAVAILALKIMTVLRITP